MKTDRNNPYRIVSFPDDACVGEVEFIDTRADSTDDAPTVTGSAKGAVRVYDNEILKLTIWEAAALPHLANLGGDDLQWLEIVLNAHPSQTVNVTDVDLQYLSHLSGLTHLKITAYESTGLTDKCVRCIRELTNLIHLSLETGHVTDDSLRYLAPLAQLESLNLWPSPSFRGDGIEHIQHLTNLRRVRLSSTPVARAGVRYLANLQRLEEIEVDFQEGGTDQAVSQITTLKSLKRLDLSWTPLSDDGMRHVSALSNLRSLHIHQTNISEHGLIYLHHLRNLENLFLDEEFKHYPQIATLRTTLPNLMIHYYRASTFGPLP